MKKILKDPKEINELIASYKQEGYSRIHLSGGTSKEGGHFSGVIVYYYDPIEKSFSFVGLPYDPNFHKRESSTHGNGHTKKKNETPEETAFRELFEETGLKAKIERFVSIHYNQRPDNRPGMNGQIHHQYYFMININDCTGELSSFEGPNPTDGETLAPRLFIKTEFEKILFHCHKLPLLKAIDKLRLVSMEYYDATCK